MRLTEVMQSYRSKKGILITRDLIRKSALLETADFQPASHADHDEEEVALSFGKGGFRNYNAGVSSTGAESGMIITQIFPHLTWLSADARLADAYDGGINGYLKKKGPLYGEGIGKSIADQGYYGDTIDAKGFSGLRQKAIVNGNYSVKNEGGAGEDCCCLMAVKWDRRECCFVYPESNWKKGKLISFKSVNSESGKPVIVALEDSDGNEYDGYKFFSTFSLGLKVISTKNVGALLGLKNSDDYKPSKNDIRDLINSIAGIADGQTFLYGNRTAKTLLGEMLDNSLTMQDRQKMNIPLWCDSFEKIPFALDETLTQTESFNS
jgi:Major capsid protein GP7